MPLLPFELINIILEHVFSLKNAIYTMYIDKDGKPKYRKTKLYQNIEDMYSVRRAYRHKLDIIVYGGRGSSAYTSKYIYVLNVRENVAMVMIDLKFIQNEQWIRLDIELGDDYDPDDVMTLFHNNLYPRHGVCMCDWGSEQIALTRLSPYYLEVKCLTENPENGWWGMNHAGELDYFRNDYTSDDEEGMEDDEPNPHMDQDAWNTLPILHMHM